MVRELNNWLGVTFSEKFGNSAFDKDEQKELINEFIQEAIKNMRIITLILRI
ncbi:MAG: hypothetical protein JW717_00745 [Marinilabiliaceae bacterium]|nr:hypothetical protein [Marinilabiliaceae bacterium]